jgi:hypothetical protein
MKLFVLSLIMVGCGSGRYDVTYKEEKGDDETSETDEKPKTGKDGSLEDDRAPVGSSGVAVDGDTTKALVYSYIELPGVSRITSVAKIINTLYFTGADAQGHRVLGRVKPGSSKAELTPFGRLSANYIALKDNDYYLPTNLDEYIYLADDHEIIQVDLATLQAVGKVSSPCAIKAPLTYIKDSQWNTIWSSQVVTCGLLDGAEIGREGAVDSYTGQPHNFDNYGSYSFDSENIWRYAPRAKQLVRYSMSFAEEEVYSTSAFLYNGETARFVSDSNGGMWFFGCGEKACVMASTEIADQ